MDYTGKTKKPSTHKVQRVCGGCGVFMVHLLLNTEK